MVFCEKHKQEFYKYCSGCALELPGAAQEQGGRSKAALLGLRIATDDHRKIGWTYSYEMLDEIHHECIDAGFGAGMEEVQEVLFALERRGIITRPSS